MVQHGVGRHQWILQGASWSEHWAYITPTRTATPKIDSAWIVNWIDAFVLDRLTKEKLVPSPDTDDITLLRRLCFDLTGLPPDPATVQKFHADPRDNRVKRDELIDSLIGTDEFVEHWSNKWADLLQVNRKYLGKEGSTSLRSWIREQIDSNRPYDAFVYVNRIPERAE